MRLPGTINSIRHLLSYNRTYLKGSLQRRIHRIKSGTAVAPTVEEVLSRPYVFVLSTGRCGTGLITEILANSPFLRVEHDPKPGLEHVSSVIHRDNVSEEALKLAVLAARFDLFFVDTLLRGKIYVETNNRISLFAPALARLLPNSKFIHLVRDPADFVRSGMRRCYYQEDVVQHQRLDGSRHLSWSSFSRLEKVAWEWNEINNKIEDFKGNVEDNRVLTLNSESLYKCPATTSAIFKLIDVENPFAAKGGERTLLQLLAKPVNKQREGSFPQYSDWSEGDKNAFRRTVSLAPKYGYFYL